MSPRNAIAPAIIAALLGSLLLLALWAIFDRERGVDGYTCAEVVSRDHTPARSWTSFGFEGKRTVMHYHHTPEAWSIVIRDEYGVRSLSVGPLLWADAKEGSRLLVCATIGASGHRYDSSEYVVGPWHAEAEKP